MQCVCFFVCVCLCVCVCVCVCVHRAFFNRSNLTLSGVQGSPAARRILLTHILPSFPFTAADDIPQGNTTVQNANNATGEVLTITRTGNNVTVRGAGNTSPVRVIQADLPAAMVSVHACVLLLCVYVSVLPWLPRLDGMTVCSSVHRLA